MQLPVIKHAFVRRYTLPTPRIIVEVMEEFPWASFGTNPDSDPTYVIAESGRFIPIKDFPKVIKPKLQIYGQPGLHLSSKEVAQWATWIAYIEKQTARTVEIVDLRHVQDVRVQAGDLYLKLGSPDASLSRRLARLASLEGPIASVKDRLEYIDLGLDSNIPLKLAKKSENSSNQF
jgi:hypothetical protein